MLFNSWYFPVFLGIILTLYYLLPRRGQNLLLIAASYFFYGCWDWRFLGLLLYSTVADYWIGIGIENSKSQSVRKTILVVSLVVNLSLLGFFKYFNFFVDSFATMAHWFGLQPHIWTLKIILPVGISFYTFQTISYIVDVYRGRIKACRDPIVYACFVSYFPQLVAGPIERYGHMVGYYENKRRVTPEFFQEGVVLILIGYLKKIAIADSVAPIVGEIFRTSATQSSGTLILGIVLFAMQIYGDFCGYTDIARGVSKLLGIDLMINFKQPYLSANITEFWRRWHISLSSWLRDYLYISLGGNRKGPGRTYVNLMLTMLLGGLWHGASWNFVIWGGLHGIYLAVHKKMMTLREAHPDLALLNLSGPIWRVISTLFTFGWVCLSWIFFRAVDFKSAWSYLTGIFTHFQMGPFKMAEAIYPLGMMTAIYLAIILLLDYPMYRGDREFFLERRHPWWIRGLAYGCMILLITYVGENNAQPFIYFQF